MLWRWRRGCHNGLNLEVNDATLDPDRDGLGNLLEYQIGTKANVFDTDRDGLPDGFEYRHRSRLRPTVWDDKNLDPDGDGITDKWEAFYGFDPTVADGGADPDGDGLSSAEEIAGGSSPVDADIDADGLNDKQEREQGTSPWRGDTDYDSLRDGWEVANGFNPNARNDPASDGDNDGLSDWWEARQATNPRVAVLDPLGRWTGYQWCRCGDLRELHDALGRVTKWKHDVQGRVTAKVYPDNSTEYYDYDLSSRLATITDATGQVRRFIYNRDDTMAAEKYLNAVNPTPEVGYSWNGTIRRLDAVSDGSGATKFTYHPYGSVGGGRVASVDGPLASDTVTTGYDTLGRTAQLAIAGSARDFVYDAGSRLTRETNALGAFDYTYVGGTRRLAGMSGPNGLAAAFSYLPNGQDRRLQGIAHTGPGGVAVSAFGYGYDAGGSITRWTQNQPSHTMEPMSAWRIEQDAADQLTGVSVEGRSAGRQVFSYDLAGNRLTAQSGNTTSTTAYNVLNQITGISGGGKLRFLGTTSEAANVSVQCQRSKGSGINY